MYSIVLMAALATSVNDPACCGRSCGCRGYGAGYYGYGCAGACYGGCYGCYGCYGACYGASAFSCYGYGACQSCAGGYCMGGYTNYAPGVIAPAPSGPAAKPETVPPPKVKPAPEQTSLPNQARLIVEVPADARLYIDGMLMKTGATRRVFRTPALDRRLTYYYDVKVEVVRDGKTISNTRRVIVRAGENVRTAFADMPARRSDAIANAAK